MRAWKNIFHANRKQKKAGEAILISDKIDFKITITRDKEGHYIMIKGSMQEEDITIVNFYAPNIVSKVTQSCPALGDPMDCSLPGSSVYGIYHATVLEWVAICSPNIGAPQYIR